MRLFVALVCAVSFVALGSQAYPVQIHTCAAEKGSCCESDACKCADCGHVMAPHAPVALIPFFHLHATVSVEGLPDVKNSAPSACIHQPPSPPPKLARV